MTDLCKRAASVSEKLQSLGLLAIGDMPSPEDVNLAEVLPSPMYRKGQSFFVFAEAARDPRFLASRHAVCDAISQQRGVQYEWVHPGFDLDKDWELRPKA